MGGSTYSRDDYDARSSYRRSTGSSTFAYHDKVRTGKAHGVHPTLSPKGVKMREARDSESHPVSIPIALCNDLTGSMQSVPITLQAKEPELMGLFLKDRADGKRYLGEGYPAIMIAGVDDYFAAGAEWALQIGQFESGIEIDDNLTNLVLTGQGGGNWGESYDLFLYFLARHTVHDHWEKRGRKGYAFIVCDEPLFARVHKDSVNAVIGDTLQSDIPIKSIIAEVQNRYHLFCIIPNQTSHYESADLREGWKKAIGEQNVLLLDDPTKICELIVATVATVEGQVSYEELEEDGVGSGAVKNALMLVIKEQSATRYSADALPAIAGAAGGIERI